MARNTLKRTTKAGNRKKLPDLPGRPPGLPPKPPKPPDKPPRPPKRLPGKKRQKGYWVEET